MKKIIERSTSRICKLRLTGFMLVAAILFMTMAVSCGNNQADNNDSVDSAMNINDQMSDDSALAVNPSDADFLVKAANGGMAEVAAGKIAKEKGSSQSVKDFGAKMVEDHSKINDRLKALAADLNVTIPASIDQSKQGDIDKLNSESVEDFDKTYLDMMVKDHDHDVDEFQKAAKDISNPDIHTFITETLPILQAHQKMVKQLDAAAK